MPNRDGTGPQGRGPASGWGAGLCVGAGGGRGAGFGQGRRRGWAANQVSAPTGDPGSAPGLRGSEEAILAKLHELQQEMSELRQRLGEKDGKPQ
jgi:hypothetical protein